MKEFFLILFFSKTILLTSIPVTIWANLTLTPSEPLTAITSGASLHIDVSHILDGAGIKNKGIVESRKILSSYIPEHSVSAVLFSHNRQIVLDKMNFALSNEGALLVLSSTSGIPTNIEFDKIDITSKIELSKVNIYWKNFRE